MRTLSAFVLTLALTTTFAADAYADGKHDKHPGLWIKYENLAMDSGCFKTKDSRALFCPYDATFPVMRSTTFASGDLPPIIERVYLSPAQLKLSKKQ